MTSPKSRKELNREYQSRPKPAGVFEIKNTINGKILLGSSLNLEGPLNGHRFMLFNGSHLNQDLQKDWDELGADKFLFAILEVVNVPENDPSFNLADELTLIEQIWWEKLQPLSPNGYNLTDKIRQV